MQGTQIHPLQSWLTTRLADQLGLAPEAIDSRKPFAEYGLDSMVGVFLAGDLEEWLGLKLSPTVLWDYPTTETLVQYLAVELQNQGVAIARTEHPGPRHLRAVPLDPQEAEQLVASLDALSDAEVDRLLSDLLARQCKAV